MREKKAFYPGNGKQLLIVRIHIFKNLKKLSPSTSSEISPLKIFLNLEDKVIFDLYAIIILCHLGKRNVIDFPFLFNCIEELRNNRVFQDN